MVTYKGHAKHRTDVKGWVCTKCNAFYGDGDAAEHAANYCCAEVGICDACGTEIPKHSYCQTCRDKQQQDKYEKMEVAEEWDWPLVLSNDDHYFFNQDELLEWIEDEDISPQKVQLITCIADYGPEVDDCIFESHLPEDWDEPNGLDEIQEAMDNLNAVIRKHGPHCYYPGKKKLSEEDMASIFAEINA